MARHERANRRRRDEAFFAGLPGLSAALKEYVAAPRRDFDLDSRFQEKIAFLLNFRLRGFAEKSRDVSFRTISRLVVLFYVASDLAAYDVDSTENTVKIKTTLTKKRLRVQTVDQNLRRVKLNKCR